MRQGALDDPRDTRPVVPAGRGQILQFPTAGAVRDASGADAARTQSAEGPPDLSSAELFALLWQALADVLGTAAAATLLHRAAARATPSWPELAGLSIKREALEHAYRVPNGWNAAPAEPPQALHALVRELWLLLIELTGSVVVARLSQVPALRDSGLVPPREQQP